VLNLYGSNGGSQTRQLWEWQQGHQLAAGIGSQPWWWRKQTSHIPTASPQAISFQCIVQLIVSRAQAQQGDEGKEGSGAI